MKKEDLLCYEGKKIKMLLKNGFVYTCFIEEISDDCIKIRDRFDNLVMICLQDISLVTELNKAEGERDD